MATNNKDFKVKNGLVVSEGGSFGAPVSVGEPFFPEHAATKAYVDESSTGTTVSPTPPEDPTEGMQWYNSTDGATYIYYDSFWVEQSSGGEASHILAQSPLSYDEENSILSIDLTGYATEQYVDDAITAGPAGAGYDFPLKEADPADDPLPDPVSPTLPTPGNDGRIEWALEAQSLELYGEVGAYKVGDYVQIGSTSDIGKYLFGTVGEIQDLGLTTEKMIIAIQDSIGDSLPYLTNESRTVSLAARKNPGYRFPLVPLELNGSPIFNPDNPTWPDFGSGQTWEDVASDNEIQLPGSLVGDYKVGDYVRLYSDEDAPGVYYLGTVIETAFFGTSYEYLTVVIQDAVGDQSDFLGLTSANRRLSIEPRAGEDGAPGADGEAGQGLLYRGDYDYETTYNAGDVVATAVGASGGNPYPPQPLYVSLIDNNLDNDPSSSPLAWSFLVNRISDDGWASKQNVVSGVFDTEIGYLAGTTSGIQGQIDNTLERLDSLEISSIMGSN